MVNDIMQLLRWRRKANSKTLKQFIKHYMGQWDLEKDNYGNLYTRIGTAPILWSCHLDTVHRKEGWQNVRIDSNGIIRQAGMKSRCLGADDGAGIWLMLEMIDMRKEGLYIFHLDEEIGGRGSDWITTWNQNLVDGIKYAVAFDRKDTGSIITNQWGVCCSNEFGESLSKELGMGHILDTTGRFTDTDNYKDLIPECTNVSAGYFNEHTPKESLDFNYLKALRDSLIKLDVSKLVVKRDPNKYNFTTTRRRNGNLPYDNHNDDDYWEGYNESIRKAREEREARRAKEALNTPKFCKLCNNPVSKDLDGYCSVYCSSKISKSEKPDLPVVLKTPPGVGVEKYLVEPGNRTKTNIENIERLCSLNSRKIARVLLDSGATYKEVLTAFLDMDMTKPNVAKSEAEKDSLITMITKYILGGK